MEKKLYNTVDKKILQESLERETFKRKTISFYRYYYIEDPQQFRDDIYTVWDSLDCFGRIYVAREGINAQMSVPEHNWNAFELCMKNWAIFREIPIKHAIEDDGKSFFKLTIKVRPKLVADGLEDGEYDVTNVGKHLSALEFHKLVGSVNTVVVDMRNHYESEVGHFDGAICPDADTFRDEVRMVEDMLADRKDHKVLLYCTGGIRCEKASAYLRNKGFEDVNQLYGGIIEYAQQVKKAGIESKFVGKNFVFDQRLGERVTEDIISRCHQCGKKADQHTNCANTDCHLLFIQCDECADNYEGCCSAECQEVLHSNAETKLLFREKLKEKYAQSKIFYSRKSRSPFK
jgi:UPF0176 protein